MALSLRNATAKQAEQPHRPGDSALDRKIRDTMLHVLREAKVPPEFIYAFEKTGRLVTAENAKHLNEDELAEWDAAVAEYRGQNKARRRSRC